jgi:hypothetical protein
MPSLAVWRDVSQADFRGDLVPRIVSWRKGMLRGSWDVRRRSDSDGVRRDGGCAISANTRGEIHAASSRP